MGVLRERMATDLRQRGIALHSRALGCESHTTLRPMEYMARASRLLSKSARQGADSGCSLL